MTDASSAAANKGKPPQTARQKCLSKAYNTPEGKAVQFLSPVSLAPNHGVADTPYRRVSFGS